MVDVSLPYHHELVEYLKDEIGDALRVVDAISTAEGESGYEHVYIRDDVDKTYPKNRQEEVLQEFVYHALESNYRENLFELGEYRYTLYSFEAGLILVFFEEDKRATVVSLESDYDDVLSVARDCLSYLD